MTPWAVGGQVPLSIRFPRQIIRVGSPSLLQGIFPTQGLNLSLLCWPVDSLPLSHQGSPWLLKLWKLSLGQMGPKMELPDGPVLGLQALAALLRAQVWCSVPPHTQDDCWVLGTDHGSESMSKTSAHLISKNGICMLF